MSKRTSVNDVKELEQLNELDDIVKEKETTKELM